MIDPGVLRVLDANFNRAREALRVIEEHARLVHNDRAAAAVVKTLRHELAQLAAGLPRADLLAARDIANDVGRDTKVAGELRRADADSVVRAALGRATESLRTIGEYGKIADGALAAKAEELRYRVYELEPRLVLRGALLKRLRGCGLYVLISADATRDGDWRAAARAVLDGGVRCLQLREKTLADAELLKRAEWLRDETRRREALLIINDRADVARAVGADGVHLGQDDLPIAAVRRVVGSGLLIGRSTHTPEQFAAALAEAPDYLAVGPMYASATKPQEHIAGPETLAAVRPTTDVPIVAIGGITGVNARAVCSAGADVLCVCSAVVGAPDVAAAARELLDAARPRTEQTPNAS